MSNIMLFENPEFGAVRTIEIEGQPWFVGRDICEIFGDKNSSRSIGRVDDVDKKLLQITDSLGRKQSAIFVNESGLYSLLFAMQPQKAHHDGVSDEYPIEIQQRIDKLHRFKRWVTSEVLPSIRSHGMYATPATIAQMLADPDFMMSLVKQLAKEQAINKQLKTKIIEDKPKVQFAESVIESGDGILIGDLSKLMSQNGINIGQNRLFAWLRNNGYLINRKGNSYNLPTQMAIDKDLFVVIERTIRVGDNEPKIRFTTKVTGKGQMYFMDIFLAMRDEEQGEE